VRESVQQGADILNGEEMIHLALFDLTGIATRSKTDQCGFFELPFQNKLNFVSSQITRIVIRANTAINKSSIDGLEIGWRSRGCQHSIDQRPIFIF